MLMTILSCTAAVSAAYIAYNQYNIARYSFTSPKRDQLFNVFFDKSNTVCRHAKETLLEWDAAFSNYDIRDEIVGDYIRFYHEHLGAKRAAYPYILKVLRDATFRIDDEQHQLVSLMPEHDHAFEFFFHLTLEKGMTTKARELQWALSDFEIWNSWQDNNQYRTFLRYFILPFTELELSSREIHDGSFQFQGILEHRTRDLKVTDFAINCSKYLSELVKYYATDVLPNIPEPFRLPETYNSRKINGALLDYLYKDLGKLRTEALVDDTDQ